MRRRRLLRFGWRALFRPVTAVSVALTDPDAPTPPLDGGAWIRLLDGLVRAGHRHLLLAGGEPFDHPELDAIVAYARARMQVLLVTSGRGVDAARLRRLPEVDTLAVWWSPPHADVLPALLRRPARDALGRATVEALLVADPLTAPHLVSAARAAADHDVDVFLATDAPDRWGRPRPGPARGAHPQPALDTLRAALTALHDIPRLKVTPRFRDDLAAYHAGARPMPCVAGDVLAVDAWGRPRGCRRAEPLRGVDGPGAWRAGPALAAHLRTARPSPCRCLDDDLHDHALGRGGALVRALRRTLTRGA